MLDTKNEVDSRRAAFEARMKAREEDRKASRAKKYEERTGAKDPKQNITLFWNQMNAKRDGKTI